MMASIEIERDIGKIPTLVTIAKRGSKLKVKFDPGSGFQLEGSPHAIPDFDDLLKLVYPVTAVLTVRGLNWYDRNPTIVQDSLQGTGLGPHAYTDRLEYTVPVDRVCLIEHIQTQVWVVTAAGGAGGSIRAAARITPAGGAAYIIQRAGLITDTVGDQDTATIAGAMALTEGYLLQLGTGDGAAGGTMGYSISYKGTEFDA